MAVDNGSSQVNGSAGVRAAAAGAPPSVAPGHTGPVPAGPAVVPVADGRAGRRLASRAHQAVAGAIRPPGKGTRAAREDIPAVTTSLSKPAVDPAGDGGRHRRPGAAMLPESPEILPQVANGVPRSAWIRTRRLATWHRPYAAGLLVLDYVAVVLADLIAATQLNQATSGFTHKLGLFNAIIFLFLPLAWLVVLWGNGGYDRRYLGIGTDEFKRVVRASLIVAATVSFVAFSFKQVDLSRLSVATALVGAAFLVTLLRYGARRLLHLARRRGRAVHRVLLVGALADALGVYTAVSRNPAAGMVPVGINVQDGYPQARGGKAPVPVYAGRDVVALVGELNADTVAVCGSASSQSGQLRRLAWQLEGTGIDLVVAPQLTDIAGPRVHIRPVEGLPLLYVEEPTLAGVSWLFKNVMDRVVAALGLLLLSPLLLGIAVAIRSSDRGPVFFRQPRVGRQRLLVRPGITGLWQVSGRSDLSWDDTVRLDLYYVDNWSLTFDLTIMWRTIGVVLRTKGAY